MKQSYWIHLISLAARANFLSGSIDTSWRPHSLLRPQNPTAPPPPPPPIWQRGGGDSHYRSRRFHTWSASPAIYSSLNVAVPWPRQWHSAHEPSLQMHQRFMDQPFVLKSHARNSTSGRKRTLLICDFVRFM